ncbi:SDR family oxidoreductase [Desulfobacterota bacterium AH_259_B03_O07]|nr:SDR family oxidoreductase [Desulfobacterota bacterium AH_259_B03_O07]
MKLKGINAIITGASQGLGYIIAEEFIKEGASVAICARNKKFLEIATNKLKSIAKEDQKIVSKPIDVSKEAIVKEFITYCIDELGSSIHVLVNNAGIYGPKGELENINSTEWIRALEINLLGTFYTCKYILSHMKENKFGKIINLSGGGSTSPLPRISAYGVSKTAVIRLSETLAEECRDYNIDINAIAPGALNTRLLDEVIDAGPDKVGKAFYEKALKQRDIGGVPLQKGASLAVYLASKESDGVTGKLISAVWDPWETFSEHIEELKETDIYTLRRIIPRERGKNWGER